MTTSTVEEIVSEILKGIDKDDFESKDGWWETSEQAEFGSKKKRKLIEALTTYGAEREAKERARIVEWAKNKSISPRHKECVNGQAEMCHTCEVITVRQFVLDSLIAHLTTPREDNQKEV